MTDDIADMLVETPLEPIDDRVVVKVIDSESVVGGVIIPDAAQERSTKGLVLAVGPGLRNQHDPQVRIPLELARGDVVYFTKYGGNEVQIGADAFLILREQDILAKLDTE